MICDMCGKNDNLSKVSIEGTQLNVCPNCARYGKKVEDKGYAVLKKKNYNYDKPVEMIVTNFTNIIKNSREKMGLSQEQLAKRLNEKTSTLQSVEGGRSPRIVFAKKLEKFLNIKLVETYKEDYKQENVDLKSEENDDNLPRGAATIGDLIKFKVRKKK